MLRRSLALVAVMLLAAVLWGPGSLAYNGDSTDMGDAAAGALLQASMVHGDVVPDDPRDPSGEHCFHKLAGPLAPPLTLPARLEIAIAWIDVSATLHQTHLPPAHPPPVPSA